MNQLLDFLLKKITVNNFILFFMPLFLVFVAFYDIIITRNSFFGGWHDILHYHLTDLIYQKGFFLWNNLWITGFPEFASPQSDFYYPFALFFSALFEDIFMQANFNVMLHLLIAFFTSYLLFTHVSENKTYLAIFSLSYVFSSMMLLRVLAGHELIICALAWTPLLYYSFANILYKSEINIKNIVIFTLSSALIFLTGALYYIAFPYIFMAIFLLYFIITQKTDIKAVIAIAVATIIFLLISAVKAIPSIQISDKITRIDGVIDPFNGGGSLESNLASFIFGTPINQGYSFTGLQYGLHESAIFIGAIGVFLAIIALVYGKKIITVPSFFSIVFALIWADGGKTVFSFIHLLPFLSSFRCPGRIFGSLLPIFILLSLYGLLIISQKIKEDKSFSLDSSQKKHFLYGLLIIIAVKLLELPFQEMASVEFLIASILVICLLAAIFFNKLTKNTLVYLFLIGIFSNIAFLIINFSFTAVTLIKAFIFAIVILIIIICELKQNSFDKKYDLISILVCLNIILCCVAGLSFVKPNIPGFESSPANDIVLEFNSLPTDNVQKWAVTTGWAFEDMDYTYVFMTNGIHSVSAYNAYYLNNMLPVFYTIDNNVYSIADYIVDTNYLKTGELANENYTAMVDGVPITVPEKILSNVFVVRENEIIPADILKFTPDEVIAEGNFKKGDVVVLKTAYYDGWKANGQDAESVVSMVGHGIISDTNRVVFKFEPSSFVLGAFFSVMGLVLLVALIVFRRRVEAVFFENKGLSDDKINEKKVTEKKTKPKSQNKK